MLEWQIVTGCERLSPGCDNCPTYWDYSKTDRDYHPVTHPERLNIPAASIDPQVFIVAPGSDLLHESVRESFILQVVEKMALTPQHTFEMVTKRAERLEALDIDWPDNVIVGTAVEEARYKWRIDSLARTKALRKAVSFGPMTGEVGEVDLSGIDYAGVVVETWGPHPRAVNPVWIEHLKTQCTEQDVLWIDQSWICKEIA